MKIFTFARLKTPNRNNLILPQLKADRAQWAVPGPIRTLADVLSASQLLLLRLR